MVDAPTLKASHERSLSTILKAAFTSKHARALLNMFRLCDQPFDFLKRYLARGGGTYPSQYIIKTPIGPMPITVFVPDDIMTINEIFFRDDYPADTRKRVYVDFGSNIGISTLFWLSRHEGNFVYCYEPLQQNIDRFKQNTAAFEDRIELQGAAVGLDNGDVEFSWEPTGRYGGIGLDHGATITVPCVDANEQLQRIIDVRGEIGVLKIDIESLEREITQRITPAIAAKIDRMVVENTFDENPHQTTHEMCWNLPITQFDRIS